MRFLAFALVVLIFPLRLLAETDTLLIRTDEFSQSEVRQNIDCSSASYTLNVIYRLGHFDEDAFGTKAILEQLLEGGCSQLSIDILFESSDGLPYENAHLLGASRKEIFQSATALLQDQPLTILQETTTPFDRIDKERCGPLMLGDPDDLGALLYYLVTDISVRPSPLHEFYEERVAFCTYHLWEDAIAVLMQGRLGKLP